jgi:hypothetical protein
LIPRGWVEASFAEQLALHRAPERRRIVVALIAATDVYVWKLDVVAHYGKAVTSITGKEPASESRIGGVVGRTVTLA